MRDRHKPPQAVERVLDLEHRAQYSTPNQLKICYLSWSQWQKYGKKIKETNRSLVGVRPRPGTRISRVKHLIDPIMMVRVGSLIYSCMYFYRVFIGFALGPGHCLS